MEELFDLLDQLERKAHGGQASIRLMSGGYGTIWDGWSDSFDFIGIEECRSTLKWLAEREPPGGI